MAVKKTKTSFQLTNVTFRSVPRHHDRSTFVGYVTATLVVAKALPGGLDFQLRLPEIEVNILASGPRFDFKSLKDDNGKWWDIAYPASKETREALTNAVLGDPIVAEAVKIAQEERSAA